MSDLFHEEVPFSFIQEVFRKMETYDHHVYQVLTKRPERMLEFLKWDGRQQNWPDNIWAGTSVENQYWADRRIPVLLKVPARIRFLSVEPLLRSVDLTTFLGGLQWVIVGGESGHKARPLKVEWAWRIKDACINAGVPFFFKQWGGRTSKAGGRELDGLQWDGMPEFPTKAKELVSAGSRR